MAAAKSDSVVPQLPARANPVAGAFVGTIVLAALLAPPVLILGLTAWLWSRAARSRSASLKPDQDREFSSRFQKLETDILDE